MSPNLRRLPRPIAKPPGARKPANEVRYAYAVNKEIVPPGGFKYRDRDGVEHIAPSFDKLVNLVITFRERSGQPTGDPFAEITQHICAKYPRNCFSRAEPFDGAALASAITADITRCVDRDFPRVSPEEALARESCCLHCSRIVNWSRHCPSCYRRASDLIAGILGKDVPMKLQGRACVLARDDLSLAVWRVNNTKVVSPPIKCWRSETP
jgi:hypothetical protein